MKRWLVASTTYFLLAVSNSCLAAKGGSIEQEDDTTSDASPVTSIEALGNITEGSGGYARNAEYCLQNGHVERAIKLCQLALGKKDDPDLHQIYAEALQRKLENQSEKDSDLFRKCVSEWLIVLRQSGGEENLAFHGLSLPGMGKFFEDEDRSAPAKQHIITLTGRLPKVWETNERFLNRVTRGSKTNVSGDVIKASARGQDSNESTEDTKNRKDDRNY